MDRLELLATLREAGRVALASQRAGRLVCEQKPDRTWVTDADREVESFLAATLPRLAPGSVVLGEEAGVHGAGDGDCVWAVDPIDGTADYMRGLPGWSISAALYVDGNVVCGAVHLPVTRDEYSYGFGDPDWCGSRPHVIDAADLDEDSLLLVPNGAAHRYRIEYPGKMQCVGSSSAHILWVARGAAAGGVADPLYIWDLGVAVPFLRASGGEAAYLSGTPLELAELLDGRVTPEPVVFAAAQLLEQVGAAIEEVV